MSQVKYSDKNQLLAILLALFVGVFGVHQFYLGNLKKGVLYLVFSWTAIPWFLGIYDAYTYWSNDEQFGTSTSTTSGLGASSSLEDEMENGDADGSVAVPEDAIIAVAGVNGTVTVYRNRIEISRDDIGMLHKVQHGFKGDKEIPLDSITSMQLRKPSSVTRGYIQFGQSGFSESDDGLMDATSDENTVLFDKKSLSRFEELRSKVRDLKDGSVEESTGTMDDAMEKLRERYAEGDIDEEEYEQRKEILQKD